MTEFRLEQSRSGQVPASGSWHERRQAEESTAQEKQAGGIGIGRKEVAKLAGVSEATVSRVLNGIGPVREETRRKVLAAAEQLSYVPNMLAQQLARRRSGNLGVVLPYVPKVHLFSTYYFAEILSGIGESARRRGYNLLIIPLSQTEEHRYTNLYQMQKVDACIMLGSQDMGNERAALSRLAEQQHPFCLINQRFESEPFVTVEADHVEGGRLATAHLLDQGCRRLAFLNGPLTYSNSRDRLSGYLQALAARGVEQDDAWLLGGNYSRKSGYQYAELLAAAIRDGRIDGIVAANDRMALGLLQGLRDQGIEPGRDVALIGYDDSESARFTEPQLSSVAVPFYEMGEQAAELLLAGLSGEKAQAVPSKLAVQLVERASTLRFKAE
nr:LacI family DNA-binding transcriptional regulator [Paenibacillus sp. SYP-B4298]